MSDTKFVPLQPQRKLSIRSIRKGALVDETYALARMWKRQDDVKANIARLKHENVIGASSTAWLNDVAITLAARFRDRAGVAPLIVLAQQHFSIEQWRGCLLWHLGQQDALLFAFLTEWLYPVYKAGVLRVRSEDVIPFVVLQTDGRLAGETSLSEYGRIRTARDLLLIASDFGILHGKPAREFTSYHMPDNVFLYVLHALAEREENAQRIIEAPEWRMYLMQPADVEQTLLRLHQFQRVVYHVAGSIIELRLPYPSLLAYAESLTR